MKKSPLNSLQTEVDAHYIYSQISKSEKNPHIKEIFEELSQIELGHARAMYNSLKKKGITKLPLPQASLQARILNKIGELFGYDYV